MLTTLCSLVPVLSLSVFFIHVRITVQYNSWPPNNISKTLVTIPIIN